MQHNESPSCAPPIAHLCHGCNFMTLHKPYSHLGNRSAVKRYVRHVATQAAVRGFAPVPPMQEFPGALEACLHLGVPLSIKWHLGGSKELDATAGFVQRAQTPCCRPCHTWMARRSVAGTAPRLSPSWVIRFGRYALAGRHAVPATEATCKNCVLPMHILCVHSTACTPSSLHQQ